MVRLRSPDFDDSTAPLRARLATRTFRQNQVDYLNRSLGQLTGRDSSFPEFRLPELYYLEGGVRVSPTT